MSDLIKALLIFQKYFNPHSPLHCEHDELTVCLDADKVSDEDKKELDKLGFFEEDGLFKSYRFGSS